MKPVFIPLLFLTVALTAQEVSVSVITQDSWPPGRNVPVTVKITKGKLKGFARFYHDLPRGFIVENVFGDGADFFRDNNQVNYVWLDLPDKDIVTIQYLARADELLAGSFSITGRFDYIQDGKRRVSVLAESASISLDRSASVESVEFMKTDEAEPEVIVNDSITGQENKPEEIKEADKARVSDISYRVQVSISSQRFSQGELEDRIGSKLKHGVRILETGNMFKYQSGSFKSYSEAAEYLDELKNKGVVDSFIVAYNKDSQISIKDAQSLTGK